MNTSTLLWGLLFGSVGLGYAMYGKQRKTLVPFLCGLGLMFFPYVVSGTVPLIVIGVLLMALPYFVRL